MTQRRVRKVTKLRGSKNHGWGKGKGHHKGAGSRGGRGKAGSGKRTEAKSPTTWKTRKFGRHKFTSINPVKVKTLSIKDIEERFETLLNKKLISEEKGLFHVNFNKIGYNKLLSQGVPTRKYLIDIEFITPKAKEKILQAGGSIAGEAEEE